ncbi:malto-oligosyltrehalose trehalohydrolase [Salinimicrobium catena]|uniref:malto-oligosyltrehalose trehalohydrolase n=1 Tax=Salinimicrobium catena TaxID=390640 RepID=UPI002FE43C90
MGRKVGAEYLKNDTCQFTVWSPLAEKVEVVLKDRNEPVSLIKDTQGYWEAEVPEVPPGSLYKIRLDEEDEFPDPASRSQPEGVHSWSQVINHYSHDWQDQGHESRNLEDMVIYELHVGTFTSEGTFEGIIEKLPHLEELGVNTLEIMPIAQFPGDRNWGYDGVYPYAAQDSYGGATGLKKLIEVCHQMGFSILLDVVYNHMGPEGNYLSQFGPYFTDKYHTPWGSAINLDDKYSDHVRNFFIQNAIMWLEEFHFDGLRLDAVHEIIDRGARHFLKELSEEVDALEKKTGKHYVLIAESDLNDNRLVTDYSKGGYGLEGQWIDDFHHAVHTLLTGEDAGYYQDYGKAEYLAKTFEQGFIYDGIYSKFRKRRVGNSPKGIAKNKFVACIQNHDQVGNRVLGERLGQLITFEEQKLAAGTLLTSPFVPLLFMGEEFGETNPFRYFISHGDPELVKAVQEGRKREFEYFDQKAEEFPDPQSKKTFEESRPNWNFKEDQSKNTLFEMYKLLLKMKKEGAFHLFGAEDTQTKFDEENKVLQVTASDKETTLMGIYNFGKMPFRATFSEEKKGEILIASADKIWLGEEEFPKERIQKTEVPAKSFMIIKI